MLEVPSTDWAILAEVVKGLDWRVHSRYLHSEAGVMTMDDYPRTLH